MKIYARILISGTFIGCLLTVAAAAWAQGGGYAPVSIAGEGISVAILEHGAKTQGSVVFGDTNYEASTGDYGPYTWTKTGPNTGQIWSLSLQPGDHYLNVGILNLTYTNAYSGALTDTIVDESGETNVIFPGSFAIIATLVVRTNGDGATTPNYSGKYLKVGSSFPLTALPKKGWIFSNWVASGSESFVSNNPVLRFTMQSNLVLTANFVTNVFLAAQGHYYGLFSVTNAPREQTNSGGFNFNLTSIL